MYVYISEFTVSLKNCLQLLNVLCICLCYLWHINIITECLFSFIQLQIGSLLQRTNFLMNTPRGDSNYRIKSLALMEFRKEQYNAIDEKQRQNDIVAVSNSTDDALDDPITQSNYIAITFICFVFYL